MLARSWSTARCSSTAPPARTARVDLSPQQRKTALLFQNYMLFPNLTVAQNVAAGIDQGRAAGRPRRHGAGRAQALRPVGLRANAIPSQLSGGQQQRVALGAHAGGAPGHPHARRAVLRARRAPEKACWSRTWSACSTRSAAPSCTCRHDIDEALRFCDRIAVVESGHIMEVGTGDDLVNRPQSARRASSCRAARTPRRRSVAWPITRCGCPKWGVRGGDGRRGARGRQHAWACARSYLERAGRPGAQLLSACAWTA